MTTQVEDLSALEELLDGLVTIPTIPSTLMQINQILDDPDGSAKEAGEVVAKDPAVAAKVLRLVNSAYYALKNPVSNISFAVSILGLKVLKNLVVQATILEAFGDCDGMGGISSDWIWDHSFKTAVTASEIAKLSEGKVVMIPEDAYTCGLIHDVGRIIMADALGPKYARILLKAKRSEESIHNIETEAFKFNHCGAGALLSEQWRLSPRISIAILNHHDPKNLENSDNEDDTNLGHLIHAANTIAHECSELKAPYKTDAEINDSLERMGINEEALEEIKNKTTAASREA